VNGAAARHFHAGDRIIIAAFAVTDEPVEPKMIAVDEHNRVARILSHTSMTEELTTPRR